MGQFSGKHRQQHVDVVPRKANKSTSSVSSECAEPKRYRPVFTILTAFICSVLLIVEFFENGRMASPEFPDDCHFRVDIGDATLCAAALNVNPLLGPPGKVLVQMGGLLGESVKEQGEFWRLLSAIYLHGGAVHLILNMIVLIHVGIPLEIGHGPLKVGAVYLLSGIFGSIMSAIFAGHAVSVGASGAIFGLIGASLGELLQNWGIYRNPWKQLASLVFISAVQLLLGTIPMLDNFAHLFGFAMGFLSSLSLLILNRVTRSGRHVGIKCHHRIVQVAATALVPFVFLIAFLVLFRGDGHKLCPGCYKISCTPFPWGCDESQPTGFQNCWWECSTVRANPKCSATAFYVNDVTNGTVVVHCPVGNGILNVTESSLDVSNFDQRRVARMCIAKCPDED